MTLSFSDTHYLFSPSPRQFFMLQLVMSRMYDKQNVLALGKEVTSSHCSSPHFTSHTTQFHTPVSNPNHFSFRMACMENHPPSLMLWQDSCWVWHPNSAMVFGGCADMSLQAWPVISLPQPQQQKQNQHNSIMAN